MSWLDVTVLLAGAATLAYGVAMWWLVHKLIPLKPTSRPALELPTVSIVAAARNEQDAIESAVRSWLFQDAIVKEIIVVNDRSTDATASILERIAPLDPRLQVIHLSDRPDDWLGKNHALHVGAQKATGDFILFTDADVHLQPNCLRSTLAYAQEHAVDHLVLCPKMISSNLFQTGLTALFFQALFMATINRHINEDNEEGRFGIGAYNLVRAKAYRSVGGHEQIRLQIGDDIELGRWLKRHGYRQRIVVSRDLAEVQWQEGLWGAIRGLEKNMFWGLGFRMLRVLAYTGLALGSLWPVMGLFTGGGLGLVGLIVWIVGFTIPYVALERVYGNALLAALVHPISMGALVVAMWNSTIRTLIQRGVRWRDDFFPLGQLREANRAYEDELGKPKRKLGSVL